LETAITKIALSVDSFITSYSRLPNESEFFEALSTSSEEFGESCTILGSPNFECLFKPTSRQMPKSCDLSGWRSDKEAENPCYMRYYGGRALYSYGDDANNYRLYARMFGKEGAFFVYDSTASGVVYKCPSTINDFENLEECNVF